MKAKYQAEWDALKTYEKAIVDSFANPMGKDNYEFERAKKYDPEHQRLLLAFLLARDGLTGKTITNSQIKALLATAKAQGAKSVVRTCKIALDDCATHRTAGQITDARQKCAVIINNAASLAAEKAQP